MPFLYGQCPEVIKPTTCKILRLLRIKKTRSISFIGAGHISSGYFYLKFKKIIYLFNWFIPTKTSLNVKYNSNYQYCRYKRKSK